MYKISVQVPTHDVNDWKLVTSVLATKHPAPADLGTNLETGIRDAGYFVKTKGKAVLLKEQLANSLKAIGHNDFTITYEKQAT